MQKESGETYSILLSCGKIWLWPIRLQNGAMSQACLKKNCDSDLKEPDCLSFEEEICLSVPEASARWKAKLCIHKLLCKHEKGYHASITTVMYVQWEPNLNMLSSDSFLCVLDTDYAHVLCTLGLLAFSVCNIDLDIGGHKDAYQMAK